jgi:spore coat protein A
LQRHLPVTFADTQPSTDIIPTATHIKSLIEDNEDPVTGFGRLRQMISDETTDPITYLDTPTDVATVGEVQRWEIYNLTGDTHPMHFHLVNVAVRSRQQWAFNTDGSPVLPLTKVGPVHPPDPNEMGWRETVRMNPGEVTTVDMKFDLPAGTPPPDSPRLLASYGIHGAEYLWHCHILEHEEHDMMHALVVVPAAGK